jgi:hypothetical protein
MTMSKKALKLWLLLSVFCLCFATGCGGDVVLNVTANIEIDPPNKVLFSVTVDGEVSLKRLQITNSGESTLDISSIELEYEAQTPDELDQGLSFSLASASDGADDLSGTSFPVLVEPTNAGTGNLSFSFWVRYRHYADGFTRTAKLHIYSNDPDVPDYALDLIVAEGKPTFVVNPEYVVFESVNKGDFEEKTVTLRNVGALDLLIDEILLLGHEAFTLIIQEQEFVSSDPIVFDPPIVIAEGQSVQATVRFAPLGREEALGKLVVMTNDPTLPSGLEIDLIGNSDIPCLEVTPKQIVDFKGQLVGAISQLPVTLSNCGNQPVVISSLALTGESHADFGLEFSALSTGLEPTDEGPIVIGVNGAESFSVTYLPEIESPLSTESLNGSNVHVPSTGTLLIFSNSFESEIGLEVTGFGVTQTCASAIIEVVEGEAVIPQTNLHLKGDGSYSPTGDIDTYLWSVDEPNGEKSVFIPSPTWPNPTFQANIAGDYVFHLEVWDEQKNPSCEIADYHVAVVPDEAIHIELIWDTGLDDDQTDSGPSAGSDLDLHFVHPFAGGLDHDFDGQPDGWFDMSYDCFFYNTEPEWGNPNPNIDDNPGIDRDDSDGAGPENVNLNEPEDVIYRVGVHYFEDNGYGPSVPTIKVYIYTSPLLVQEGPELVEGDIWEAATIDWPNLHATPVDMDPATANVQFKVTPNYPNPIK